MFWLLALILSFYFSTLTAQNINSKIVDSITQEPIPYATVQINKKGVITNEEGRFSFLIDATIKPTDSLVISCIGYETLSKPLNEFAEPIISLHPKAIELNPVVVTNKNYTPEEIIDLVKANLTKNYPQNFTKKRLFFRDAQHQSFSKTDYTFVKSTIKELNKAFLDSVLATVPKNSSYYTEVLGDFYGNTDKEKQKLDLIRASELYDKNKEVDLTQLEEKFNAILKSNIKPDSYFKVKSGLFGTKIDGEDFDDIFEKETDSTDVAALNKELEDQKKREEDRKMNFANHKKRTLGGIWETLFFTEEAKIDFLKKSKRYLFSLSGITYMGNDIVYVVNFEPKGKSDYKGTAYINADDFGIVRLDYENVKSLRTFNLLGISFNEYLEKGKVFFSKEGTDHYQLRYFETELGSRVGIKRPLKIIEMNKHVKGRRKQNELSLKIDMGVTSINKQEIIVYDVENITNAQLEGFTENNTVLPTYMPSYDPNFWAGYSIIEPNQAIKEFASE